MRTPDARTAIARHSNVATAGDQLSTPPNQRPPPEPKPSPALSSGPTVNARRAPKISRACDTCKSKKARCNGCLPCARCSLRGLDCTYSAKYSRGRPPTPLSGPGTAGSASIMTPAPNSPPPSVMETTEPAEGLSQQQEVHQQQQHQQQQPPPPDPVTEPVTARGSPELDSAEIGGQFFEPTSGLTFLHRAHKRLLTQHSSRVQVSSAADAEQPLMCAGDRPFASQEDEAALPPDANALLAFYFDICVVTYRMFHRQTVESWLNLAQRDVSMSQPVTHTIGKAKAAVIFTLLAIASHRKDKMGPSRHDPTDSNATVRRSDPLCVPHRLPSLANAHR
jgi:hypothetical protein